MTEATTPDEAPLCAHCKRRTVPPSRGTKPRRYCGRSCVQRAYELRQRQLLLAAALEVEKERSRQELRAVLRVTEARERKSREDAPIPAKSREDAADLRERGERPGGKSREDAPPAAAPRPRRVTDYLQGMPKLGW